MSKTIKQWGNSAAVRIPRNILKESELSINDSIEFIAFQGGITLQKKGVNKFSDFAIPLISTKNWKFKREEANER